MCIHMFSLLSATSSMSNKWTDMSLLRSLESIESSRQFMVVDVLDDSPWRLIVVHDRYTVIVLWFMIDIQ